jgi:hypothetical protein
MKRAIFILTQLFALTAFGQARPHGSIELSGNYRFEDQGDYVTRYGDRTYDEHIRQLGQIKNFEIHYKRTASHDWFYSGILGYSKFEIDRIRNNPLNSDQQLTGRNVNFRYNMTALLYGTNHYYYDNVIFGIGGGRLIKVRSRSYFITEINILKSFSYRQTYNSESNVVFRTKDWRGFGFQFDGRIGVMRNYRSFSLAANFIQTIFKQWPGDKAFLESPEKKQQMWFSGWGFGLTLGHSLN